MTFTRSETESCRTLAELALTEDLGEVGDRTSLALIPRQQHGRAAFVSRQSGAVAGLPALNIVTSLIDPKLSLSFTLEDGSEINPGTVLGNVTGPLRALLVFERTALNFVQRLSGIATLTRAFVDGVKDSKAEILDTRKTVPGWRLLDKYAVRMGGGTNHRMGLYDGILIKDNHLAGLQGDIRTAVARARQYPGNDSLRVEVEVDTLDQLEVALAVRADIVLLDNMPVESLREAVARRDIVAPRTLLEASGGVTLQTIRAIAATGVDRISVGAITHSAPALDIGLDYLS